MTWLCIEKYSEELLIAKDNYYCGCKDCTEQGADLGHKGFGKTEEEAVLDYYKNRREYGNSWPIIWWWNNKPVS